MEVTAYDLAQRFVGTKEVSGATANPTILSMLRLDDAWPADDSVPWCSAFVNYIAWLLRLPRSKNLAARSWLAIGVPVSLDDARVGFDVVVLKRGDHDAGSDVVHADGTFPPGHVGFFSHYDAFNNRVQVLGGNQHDAVSLQVFPVTKVLGVRRIR